MYATKELKEWVVSKSFFIFIFYIIATINYFIIDIKTFISLISKVSITKGIKFSICFFHHSTTIFLGSTCIFIYSNIYSICGFIAILIVIRCIFIASCKKHRS